MRRTHTTAESALSLRWLAIQEHFQLSPSETRVAGLLFFGLTRKEIARILNRSPGTVRVFIDRLYRKLGVKDRLALVVCVMKFWNGEARAEEPFGA
jgi:DNA-binding NarL/FixJ family response regulator